MSIKNFVALDLEYNQPSQKIIEVGIAYTQGEGRGFGRKNWLVNIDEALDEHVSRLTGIPDEQLRDALSLKQVVVELSAFLGTIPDLHPEPIVWGHGDLYLLKNEAAHADVLQMLPWRGNSIDVGSVAKMFAINTVAKKGRMGLKTALSHFGFEFQGRQHRAADDALNTLILWDHFLSRQEQLKALLKSLGSIGL